MKRQSREEEERDEWEAAVAASEAQAQARVGHQLCADGAAADDPLSGRGRDTGEMFLSITCEPVQASVLTPCFHTW